MGIMNFVVREQIQYYFHALQTTTAARLSW